LRKIIIYKLNITIFTLTKLKLQATWITKKTNRQKNYNVNSEVNAHTWQELQNKPAGGSTSIQDWWTTCIKQTLILRQHSTYQTQWGKFLVYRGV
jgi:hypothetical protein